MLQYSHHLFLSMTRRKKITKKKSLMRCSLPEASYNFAIFVTKHSEQRKNGKMVLLTLVTSGYTIISNIIPLPLGSLCEKKDRSQKLTCQLDWNCPFPWDLSLLCKNKLNRASKQHILTTTRTQQPNEPFFVVEKAIRHLWSVIWPDCQQPT